MYLLVLILGINRLATFSLSNTKDEMKLMEAHYAAERGARWFYTYCNGGNHWDYTDDIDVETYDMLIYILKQIQRTPTPNM